MPPRPPSTPNDADIAELRTFLAVAERDPWLASLFMRRLGAFRRRLDDLRAWLAALPRQARRALIRRWALAAPLAALLIAIGGRTADAATIPVGGGCTLSAAIVNANNDDQSGSASCAAGSGTDTIALAGGTFLIDTNYGGPLPAIASAITIEGNGATLDAELAGFGVLGVTAPGDLTLLDTTVTGTDSFIGGIGIQPGAAARIERSTVTGNTAVFGGGIFNGGSLYLLNSEVSGNYAGVGGGIRNGFQDYVGTARVVNSTISGNTAAFGGGISNYHGSIHIEGSALTGNTATVVGGGFANGPIYAQVTYPASAEIVNSTISGNVAQGGGGLFNVFGMVSLIHVTLTDNNASLIGGGIYSSEASATFVTSSIVADQAAGDDCAGFSTYISSGGYNLESGTSCGFTMTGDIQNGNADLGPLANNGGPTFTHALGPASDALNTASNAICAAPPVNGVDQRGVVRPQPVGGICDIGAFELVPTIASPTAAEVIGFTAAPDPTGRIRIAWETASEVDVAGFRVERAVAGSPSPHGPPSPPSPWTAVSDLIPARGSAAGGARYTLADLPGVGSFRYRLEIVHTASPPEVHGPVGAVVRALRAFLPAVLRH